MERAWWVPIVLSLMVMAGIALATWYERNRDE